jgi:hypothetical protein
MRLMIAKVTVKVTTVMEVVARQQSESGFIDIKGSARP